MDNDKKLDKIYKKIKKISKDMKRVGDGCGNCGKAVCAGCVEVCNHCKSILCKECQTYCDKYCSTDIILCDGCRSGLNTEPGDRGHTCRS